MPSRVMAIINAIQQSFIFIFMDPRAENSVKITKQIERKVCQKGKLLNQYLKIKRIGEGNFSKIKLMTDINTNKQYAMKKYNMHILKKKVKMGAKLNGQIKYSTQADQVYNQIAIMKKLNNAYVVKLHEILEDDEQQKIYLIMDYCMYGDIATWNHKTQKFTTKWTPKQIAKYFKQTAIGLQYLHNLQIVHRDIKPQNILICEDHSAKLIDFGRSVQLSSPDQKLSGSEGTYHFMAPQTLSQKVQGGYNGKLADIWSFGISLFCCVFGYLPFNDELLIKTFDKIEKGQYKLPDKLNAHQQKFGVLIQRILKVNWLDRPSLKQIIEDLQKIEVSI